MRGATLNSDFVYRILLLILSLMALKKQNYV